MVNEVESILNEIRERVRNDYEQANAPLTLVASAKDPQPGPSRSLNGMDELENSEALNRLSAHLTTTGRSWDRLPPLYSNRSGSVARLELWLKSRLKSMSRWFIWEQINFNSAVHHALSETLHALSAQRQDLAGMRAELHRDSEAWRDKFARTDQELSGLRAAIESLTAEIKKRDANQEARNAGIEARTANLEAHSSAHEARSDTIEARTDAIATQATETAAVLAQKIEEARAEITPRLAELARELRESDQELREEQRVCFKQLSLEASETAVSEDRGRRVIEARLNELETALANGKK
jgi:septal ring factor EnvC (AmiA/AmiB activator)